MDAGDARSVLPDGVSVWDREALRRLATRERMAVARCIAAAGAASAEAQGLPHVLTNADKLDAAPYRVYLRNDGGRVLGFVKVGRKRLFVARKDGALRDVEPVCVLDFFVPPRVQRMGVGRALFEHMLAAEGIEAHEVGFDRPTPALLAFLSKHFGLERFVPQTTHFVVFDRFFGDDERDADGARGGPAAQAAPRAVRGRSAASRPPSSSFDTIFGGAAEEAPERPGSQLTGSVTVSEAHVTGPPRHGRRRVGSFGTARGTSPAVLRERPSSNVFLPPDPDDEPTPRSTGRKTGPTELLSEAQTVYGSHLDRVKRSIEESEQRLRDKEAAIREGASRLPRFEHRPRDDIFDPSWSKSDKIRAVYEAEEARKLAEQQAAARGDAPAPAKGPSYLSRRPF